MLGPLVLGTLFVLRDATHLKAPGWNPGIPKQVLMVGAELARPQLQIRCARWRNGRWTSQVEVSNRQRLKPGNLPILRGLTDRSLGPIEDFDWFETARL